MVSAEPLEGRSVTRWAEFPGKIAAEFPEPTSARNDPRIEPETELSDDLDLRHIAVFGIEDEVVLARDHG